jgi:hypothetical protein
MLLLKTLAYYLNVAECKRNIFKYNIILSFFDDKERVEQLMFGMCFENLDDEIVNKFNSVENMLKEYLPRSCIDMKLKELSAEKRWEDFYLINL